MKTRVLILGIFLTSSTVFAQTWNETIAPIIYENCSSCHHYGGIGSISLTSYEEASNYSEEIAQAVSDGIMPPWPANENYRHFKGEKVLSVAEVTAIVDWVNGGSPEGSGAAPEPPSFNDGPLMDDADFIWNLEEFTVPTDDDYYRSFVIPLNNAETVYISGKEFIPGNTGIVHHYLLYHDATNDAIVADENDPGPGFATNGAAFPVQNATLIGGWAPGAYYDGELPLDVGMEVPPNSNLILEIHFAPGSLNQTDNSQVRIKYHDSQNIRPLYNQPTLYHYPPCLQEPWLIIPANTQPTFHQESDPMPLDLSVFTIFPHMHRVGQTYKVWLVTEQNDTIPVIDIDNWDFHWQYGYIVQQPLVFPQGSVLHAEATYDNTAENDDNPNDPPQLVMLGEGSSDEMMLVFFEFTYYLPGDEDVVIDSTLLDVSQVDPGKRPVFYPNPSENTFYAWVPEAEHLTVYDGTGQMVLDTGAYSRGLLKADLGDRAPGFYYAVVTTGSGVFTTILVKQ